MVQHTDTYQTGFKIKQQINYKNLQKYIDFHETASLFTSQNLSSTE